MSAWLWAFGAGQAEGGAADKALLGGKGANLAEMTRLGLPVPPGFTLTTALCRHHMEQGTYPDGLADEIAAAVTAIGQHTGAGFGDAARPLLLSVRSGAPVSMPGMMDTILNLGLSPATVTGLAARTGNPRFAWDCYRRFIAMYGKVVLGVVPAGEHDESPFERLLADLKFARGTTRDADLTPADLETLCGQYKDAVRAHTGAPFPDDPAAQLHGAIAAVLRSWNNPRADVYRRMHDIPASVGTAVTVQAMVFGNLGESSATGVCFTRDASTGERVLYGEYLANAQGEDVVAGIRTPEPVARMAQSHPVAYAALVDVCARLEHHFRDMQDLEFTVQDGRLFMLQARSGKRTGKAMVKIAVDLVGEGLIDEPTAIRRVDPAKLDELLHPTIDPRHRPAAIAKGLPASPGASIGKVVFTARQAEAARAKGEDAILVRTETSPEDIHGMKAAVGILTARGGMTCVAGDTRVLTDQGLWSAERAFEHLEAGGALRILAVDARTLRPVWRHIIAAGCRDAPAIEVSVSQTGRVDENTLRVTEDHKFYALRDRLLLKKPLRQLLDDEDFALVVDEIPGFGETKTSPALAYVAGAILSDGYVRLTPTNGAVTFIQKPTEQKADFIAAVERAFHDAFGVSFTYVRERETVSVLQGREIRGSVEDRISFRRAPAERLAWIRDHLSQWILSLDRTALQHFLAGYVDGDGTYAVESSAVRIQISVAAAKLAMLEGVALACLRLGIVPQITSNRDNFTLQIAEHVEAILAFTQRVRAEVPPRTYESRCLSVRGLFGDIADRVNYMGRVKEAIKRNLMFGVEKIRRDLLPLCPPEAYRQLEGVLGATLRSYRIKQVGEPAETRVYNFEVDAEDELDKNYVAFSSRLTPILISNSHAAVVARGMGTCCITGCTALRVEAARGQATFARKDGDLVVRLGDVVTLDGSTGEVFLGPLPLAPAVTSPELGTLMTWVDRHRRMKIRANADTPTDARTARGFGAEGIGLCRTEHMFFQPDRILAVREMILAADETGRRTALAKILPMQEGDFVGIFTEMDGLPVTIRLLDPPLHEFLPHTEREIAEVAAAIGTSPDALAVKVRSLTESNPMLGHRGCRLAITFPEIYETQAQAIAQAAVTATRAGVTVIPEIMIPFVIVPGELAGLRARVAAVVDGVLAAAGLALPYAIGTMIELPRACLVAGEIAAHADFFSFGTNDLTQSTLGLSRDDIASFLPAYLEAELLAKDPFVTLDAGGVGQLVELAVTRGRAARPGLKVGVCGEHGGDPASVGHFHRYGLDYVSCSPFRVPIARVAAARAALESSS